MTLDSIQNVLSPVLSDTSVTDGQLKPLPETTPPGPSLRHRISLDGEWTFQFGEESPGKIVVPGPWESQRRDLQQRAGTAIYERSFLIPAHFMERRVILHFGAVDYFTEVWINNTPVGTHAGGYTPFEFDISPALGEYGPDTVHTILVRVTDSSVEQDTTLPNGETLAFAEIPHGKQSWYMSVSGIWQSVWIEARPHTYLDNVNIVPDVDGSRATLFLSIAGSPHHAATSAGATHSDDDETWQARVIIEVPAGAPPIPQFIVPLNSTKNNLQNNLQNDLQNNSNGAENRESSAQFPRPEVTQRLTSTFDVPSPLLWHPDTPHLYRVLVTLECEGEVVDVLTKRWGMRKIEARDGHVYLNNSPIFLAGTLDQDFYPKTIYTPPSTEYLRDQFVKAKEMGLNLMRCHIKVPVEEYLELCDELGLLVWYELPNGARLSPAFRERAIQTLETMWERDCSHPSIIILTLMNESWGIDLNNSEQRKWLAQTYRWAKERFPTWLIVDNSACIPNFHVISDLDDYHIYFNIPDQAEDFSEWIASFIGREAGTFTGYGDAEYRRNEPLLISEFGNWGLPSVDKVFEAEGGEPYWFRTGDGATRPRGVLQRFEQQLLNRAFADYNELAASSQEQQWLSLKYEIEEMRRHSQVVGYVITEFTDINWESNGLLDMGRNPKVYYHRLKELQAQDILIPRLSPRTSFWEGETAMLAVEFSCFTGCSVAGGTLHWEIEPVEGLFEGMRGEAPVRLGAHIEHEPAYGSYPIAQVWITAPHTPRPSKHEVKLRLVDAQGRQIATNTQNIVFVPASMRVIGRNKTVWLHDPLHAAIGLSSLLTSIGFRVVTNPEPDALGLVTRWDPVVSNFLHTGGKAVLVATHAKSVTIASGLGVRLLERNTNGWWGDWCTSKLWFVPDHFPSLPDTFRFDFEYHSIVPQRVLTGPMPDNVSSGLFVGWLHNPAAIVARLPIGRGDLVVTTFDLLPNIGSDPIATLVLHDLFQMPPAFRPE